MDSRKTDVLKLIKETLQGVLPAGGHAFLYGSQARGDARADSDWDDPIDYDVRVFEPNRGSNIWVIYDQLIDGSYSKLKYRRYEGTCGVDN